MKETKILKLASKNQQISEKCEFSNQKALLRISFGWEWGIFMVLGWASVQKQKHHALHEQTKFWSQ